MKRHYQLRWSTDRITKLHPHTPSKSANYYPLIFPLHPRTTLLEGIIRIRSSCTMEYTSNNNYVKWSDVSVVCFYLERHCSISSLKGRIGTEARDFRLRRVFKLCHEWGRIRRTRGENSSERRMASRWCAAWFQGCACAQAAFEGRARGMNRSYAAFVINSPSFLHNRAENLGDG